MSRLQKLNFLLFMMSMILIMISFNGFSQVNSFDKNEQNPPAQIMTNKIIDPNIKTVLLYKQGDEQSYPIIKLKSSEKLELSFDDLANDYKDYQYTIIHCKANWEVSDLKAFEYLEGYETDLIENIQNSFRTIIPYTHYTVSFPNEYIQIKKSGNYVCKVFLENEGTEQSILYIRFMVVDPKAEIQAIVKRGFPNEEDGGYTQKLEIKVLPKINIQNSFENLQMQILQNRRYDNLISNAKATSVLPNEIRYEAIKGNDFEGGNEFRHFDTKDLRHQTEFIAKIESPPTGYIITLKADNRRLFDSYILENDLNGRYLIRNELERNNPATEADYTLVKFFLPYKNSIVFGDLYIFGQLSNWQLEADGKPEYDFERRGYICEMLLKQGYYDYAYIYKDYKKEKGSMGFIEGSHNETNNEYLILLYYQAPGTTYQQLIGSKIITSH